MQPLDAVLSHIIITDDMEAEVERFQNELEGFSLFLFLRDDFKLEDAKAVISEAYKTTSELKYIIIGAKSFNAVSQNALLKLLEEPPKKVRFIVMSPSKSILLPTIRSRLPILKTNIQHNHIKVDINLAKIDYAEVFSFLKKYNNVKKAEAKQLIEALYFRATTVDNLILDSFQLESFERAYKLLELNSRPQIIFAQLLMCFVKEK